MAIVVWPDDIKRPQRVLCAICGNLLPPKQATVGMQDMHGQPAFACNKHFKERRMLVGWVEYAFRQKLPIDNLYDELVLKDLDDCLLC